MKVGIFGVGVVGTGVIHLISDRHPELQIVKAFVKDKSKKRDNIPSHIVFVDNYNEILNDPEIELIIEVMGGTQLAWDIIRQGIENNKHIVTANKAVISKYLSQVDELLQNHPRVQLELDAAVCGGIPIIPVIKRLSYTDSVQSILGIMNGTCNYILSKMSSDQEDFSMVLKQAQEKGFAEADPSSDVMGWDTRSKVCILVRIAFNTFLNEDEVVCHGINSITQADFMYGKMLNHTIKLLGYAQKHTNPETNVDELEVSVWPTMVPLSNPLAHISGETNAIALESVNLGDSSLFIGPGAGRYPTANSVVADACQICSNSHHTAGKANAFGALPSQPLTIARDFVGTFYLRFLVRDRVGIIQAISTTLAKHGVMINSILQIPIVDVNCVPFALLTEETKHSMINKVCEEINSDNSEAFDFMVAPVTIMRCLK